MRMFWQANLQKKGVQRFGNTQGLIIITIIVWQANLQKKSEFIIYIIRMLQKKNWFYGTTYNFKLTDTDANAKQLFFLFDKGSFHYFLKLQLNVLSETINE